MEKIKVGLLTMSDGREYLHEEYAQLNMDTRERSRRLWNPQAFSR